MANPAARHILSLCSGVGGLDLGVAAALEYCGEAARVVCHVEREASAAAILAARMAEGSVDAAPLWSDLRTFDGRPWRGVVDCLLAGYPCQPFSCAGLRLGEEDPRHLWPEVDRVIGETEPPLVFLENVAAHLRMGFGTVRRDLEGRGYRIQAGLFSAAEVGASHRRERLFILAYRPRERQPRRRIHDPAGRLDAADTRRSNAELGNAPGGDQCRPELRDRAGRQVQAGRSGVVLAHAGGEHGGERRDEQPGQRGQPASTSTGLPLANSGSQYEQARKPHSAPAAREGGGPCGGPGPDDRGSQLAHANRNGQRAGGKHQRQPPDAAPGHLGMGNTTIIGLEVGRGERGDLPVEQPTADRTGIPLFAPGPGFAGWPDILAKCPELAPAVEPGLCVLADGVAVALDAARANQLRAAGNGVFPLCAAHAFITLGRRAGLIL